MAKKKKYNSNKQNPDADNKNWEKPENKDSKPESKANNNASKEAEKNLDQKLASQAFGMHAEPVDVNEDSQKAKRNERPTTNDSGNSNKKANKDSTKPSEATSYASEDRNKEAKPKSEQSSSSKPEDASSPKEKAPKKASESSTEKEQPSEAEVNRRMEQSLAKEVSDLANKLKKTGVAEVNPRARRNYTDNVHEDKDANEISISSDGGNKDTPNTKKPDESTVKKAKQEAAVAQAQEAVKEATTSITSLEDTVVKAKEIARSEFLQGYEDRGSGELKSPSKGLRKTISIKTRKVSKNTKSNTHQKRNGYSNEPSDMSLIILETGEYKTVDKPSFTIGKSDLCDLILDEHYLSRRHALITRDNSSWYIEDLGSTNGTYVNKVKVKDGKRTRLLSGDTIKLANVKMQVEI